MKKCCDYACAQGRNCPERDIFHWETVLDYIWIALAGVGFVSSCIVAGIIWGML